MTYPPRPSDDEPRSQPFQPQSYDLAPEFGTQQTPSDGSYQQQPGPYGPPQSYPAQQPYQQPAYQDPYQPSAPPYQQPYQQPDYQQPGYQQPAFPGPGPAYTPPPPAPPRKRRGLKITLGIIGALFLVCAVLSCVFLYPVISAGNTSVTAPATLPGGLSKQTSDEMQKIVDEMERDLRNDVGNVDQVAAGIYSDGDPQKLVVLVAATSTVLFPDDEVDDAFSGFSATGAGGGLGGQTSYPAGDLGGTVKCANGTEGELAMTLCAWADHGSVGIAIFIGRELKESADLFLQIRSAVETR
ncbi:hypothetical protein AB0K00_39550 [Dactylosporangium sp. NPDC049525]|uniref:hypothetical protein n=1 Tax=Dactylosporangium sp. NPDC049525 TaxID=3154730 RepID=UPI003414BA78